MGRPRKYKPVKTDSYPPPKLERYITEDKKKRYITYEEGAKLYDLPYYTFVNLAKEAKASIKLRKTAIVDKDIFEKYMDELQREGKEIMAYKRKRMTEEQYSRMHASKRKKFVRYDEGAMLYSLGTNTFKNIAREAGAIYRVGKIVLVNTEIVDEYLENYHEEAEWEY